MRPASAVDPTPCPRSCAAPYLLAGRGFSGVRTRINPAVILIALPWLLLGTLCAVGCDIAPPVDQLEAALEPTATPVPACSEEYREIVQERYDHLACIAECDALTLACLDLGAPECHYCEHDRAICASSCPGGAL